MPGRRPVEAVDAFLDPLRTAVSCLGQAHLTLSPGARGKVGETCSWTLNSGEGIVLTNGGLLEAKMHFEVLDRGASQGAHRYKVSTRAYLYAICAPSGEELYAAHWHPGSKSPVAFPHYHLGAAALAPTGVFLARAHIPSPRISFESVVRLAIESGAADPACDDWQGRLDRTEGLFEEHKTWP